jgi:hypothetical protein
MLQMEVRRALPYIVAFVAAAAAACAVGTSDGTSSDGTTDDGDASSGDDSGGGGFDAGGGGDEGGGGSDAGPLNEGGGGNDGGGGISCAATNTCPTAQSLGTVSGDTGSATANGSGATSQWLSVRVTEDDNSVIGKALKVKVTLTSPSSANFDLYLYVNKGTDQVECTTLSGSSTQTSGPDTVSLTWGEGAVANGVDDSRTVSIEVRNVSGTCDPGSTWTLLVQGNQ